MVLVTTHLSRARRLALVLLVLLAGLGVQTWWADRPVVLVSSEDLVKRLTSRDERRRENARSELQERGFRAIPALRAALTSSHSETRRAALELLAPQNPGMHSEELVVLLTDPDRSVAHGARTALTIAAGSDRHLATLMLRGWNQADVATRVKLLKLVKPVPATMLFPEDVQAAVTAAAFRDAEAEVRLEAANWAIYWARNSAKRELLPEAVPLLEDPSPVVRARAIEAAGWAAWRGGKEQLPRLVELTNDPEPGVQAAALAAGARLGWPETEAVRLLAAGMRSSVEDTRLAAEHGLACLEVCVPELVPQLHAMLPRESSRFAWSAARALGACGADAAVAVADLIGLLSGVPGTLGGAGSAAASHAADERSLREVVATALGHIGAGLVARDRGRETSRDLRVERIVAALAATLSEPATRRPSTAIRALGLIGPRAAPAAPELARLVATGGPSAGEAASALCAMGPAAAAVVPVLARTLAGDDHRLRLLAANTLRFLGCDSPDDADRLLPALGDSDSALRELAALALGGCPAAETTIGPLAERLADSDSRVRLAAAESLGRIGPLAAAASSSLRGSTDDENERVRAQAVRSLQRVDPQALVEVSDRLVSDPSADVRLELARALRSRAAADTRGPDVLACLTTDPDDAVRRAAAGTRRATISEGIVGRSARARTEDLTPSQPLTGPDGCPELRSSPTPTAVPTPAPWPTVRPTPGPYRFDAAYFSEPVKVSGPDPSYPEKARAARAQGTVVLELAISRSGKVIDVKVLRGVPHGLTEAAVEAARQWKYTPAKHEGKPEEVLYIQSVTFTLR